MLLSAMATHKEHHGQKVEPDKHQLIDSLPVVGYFSFTVALLVWGLGTGEMMLVLVAVSLAGIAAIVAFLKMIYDWL
jgi:hypothetical protein